MANDEAAGRVMTVRRLQRFAWAVVVYNVAVIVWGAFVRATGSGAGCGRHWPTCQGEVVPRAPVLETVIEFTHRSTSGLALLLVVLLVVLTRRALPPAHAARRAAVASLVLMLVEAALGAALVLFGWVAKDASPERGWVMAVHLTNTLLLLGALVLTAAWTSAPAGPPRRDRGPVLSAIGLAALACIVAGASGAIAALGDTLHPATSLGGALRQDLDAGSSLLLRLRLLHPPLALAYVFTVTFAARRAAEALPIQLDRLALLLTVAAWSQVGAGVLNLALLAPTWMQLLHLALADVTWILLAALAARATWPRGEAAP
jgi:cytochrome c oxidase assembly protein subunit 15